jgi:exopolyphosphatase/guanosine-5'-triphosphate,3'-diphosphate pyrophosphatase
MNAIIDLGSNSVRLMLTGQKTVKHTMVTRLSEGLSTYSVLSDAAMQRTLKAIYDFIDIAKKSGAHNIYIFATEAMRTAGNADIFKRKVFSKTGIQIDVLKGTDEALCGFLGAASSQNKQLIGVIDIGGASTEISIGNTDQNTGLSYCKSLPIGTVRLRDLFYKDRQSAEEYIKKTILEYGNIQADSFIGIGGTFTSLSAMLLGLTEYDGEIVDNSVMQLEELHNLTEKLWTKDDNQIHASYPVLGKERAKVIRYGAILAFHIMQFLKISIMTVSEKDNLEGYCILKNIPI